MRHLRHLYDAAVDLAVGVFDGAERLHWRIVRGRTAVFAPIAGAVGAVAHRYRALRASGVPRPDSDRVRIGMVPRVLAATVGLVAIAAVSTALAPSSSSEAVTQPNVGVAAQKASKSPAASRVARRTALARFSRRPKPSAVRAPAVAPPMDRVSATTTAPAVAQRVVRRAPVVRVQRPKNSAPVTNPPPPAPQPVSPVPQPPPAGDTNDEPPEDDNSGPGGGNGDEENGGDKDEDEDKDKDEEDKDKDEDEDDEREPPPPDDEDDDD